MRWRISQWKPRHLLAVWSGYWVGLVLITLGRAIGPIRRATSGPPNSGTIGLSFDNSMFTLKVQELGQTLWNGSASFLSVAFWVAGPPLLLWVVWLRTRMRHPQLQDTKAHLLNAAQPDLHARQPTKDESRYS